MGNSSTKESRSAAATESRSSGLRQHLLNASASPSSPQAGGDRLPLPQSGRSSRRQDTSFFSMGGLAESSTLDVRKETKQERDARRAERERLVRAKERERSLREESVDGGYLVTLGTYTGPEDYSKSLVRYLMIDRRIAPFWRGLNDHSESWTEHQLVAAARGKRIPAPDEIPTEENSVTTPTQTPSSQPIAVRSGGWNRGNTEYSTFFSYQVQAQRGEPLTTNSAPQPGSPLFRGRSRTLASLSSKNDSQTELSPPEIKLPYQPQINGQPVEAYLYKDVMECPICFLYYPPYLNRTRCCDQPICSECFVQIKRPDPHSPDHLDPDSSPPPEARRPEEEGNLISEPATCPFCVQTEFGVTYEPPSFRRGLAYQNQTVSSGPTSSQVLADGTKSGTTRRRGQSVSAHDTSVITTDRVRPDWAKKLADARAQAARRSAAATALHNAAYMMGNNGPEARVAFGRRRRHLMNVDTAGSSDDGGSRGNEGTPIPNMEMLMSALEGQSSSRGLRMGTNETSPSRLSSRGSRTDELEELMMMEAIRLSLAAEEERKKKQEKDASKEAKKEDKKKAKEQKKADKASKKQPFYSSSSANASSVLSNQSTSNAVASGASNDESKGKGKAPAVGDSAPSINTLGFSILNEPTSTLNNESETSNDKSPSTSVGVAPQHLQQAKSNPEVANTSQGSMPQSTLLPNPRSPLRHLSDASSSSSSFVESPLDSVRNEPTGSTSSVNHSPNTSGQDLSYGTTSQQETPIPASGGSGALPSADSTFNFASLSAVMDMKGKNKDGAEAAPDTEAASASKAPYGPSMSS